MLVTGQDANLGRRLAQSTISHAALRQAAATSRARDLTPSARESPPLPSLVPLRCVLRAHRPQEPQTDASLEPAPGGFPPRLPGITSPLVWLIRVEGSRGSGSADGDVRGATARYQTQAALQPSLSGPGEVTAISQKPWDVDMEDSAR
ncbi:hypothetical protein Q7P35_004676 [Cladosporium inversicolor]